MTSVQHPREGLDAEDKRALLAELLKTQLNAPRDEYPLSYGQQSMWYLHQIAPESSAYNTAFTLRILSEPDVPALERSLQTLIERHKPLRSTFDVAGDAGPAQTVRQLRPVLQTVDASGCDDGQLFRMIQSTYAAPFDLENGPLFKAILFSRSVADHVLLLTAHHIIIDGWSVWVLLDELHASYPAALAGEPMPLPPLTVEYADFVRWQRGMLAADGDRLREYWQRQLNGELPVLALPTDRPRPKTKSHNGSTLSFTLDEELSQAIKQFAKDEGVTAYTVLLAAFQTLLHRYSGQDDIIVGSPMAGRSRPEFASLVGNFINMVALRADMSDAPSFRELLGRTRETVLGAMEHQEFPFPLLVNQLAPKPDPSRTPIFQVLFDLQRIQRVSELTDLFAPGKRNVRVNLGGLIVEPYPMPQQEGQFDLTFQLVETSQMLLGAIKYNTDLFDSETIERMLGHYRTLIEGVIADPHESISTLPIMPEPELQRMLVDWNASEVDHPTDICLHELFQDQVSRTPDDVAVIFEGSQMSYRELNRRADVVARQLVERGAKPGTVVGVCMERSTELVIALLGVLKSGAAYVPLDPAYPRDRIAYMLENSRAPVLVTQPSLVGQLSANGIDVLILDSNTVLADAVSDNVEIALTAGPDDPAYVIYTSGSTGQPNGVVVSHRAIVNHMHWFLTEFGFSAADRMLQKTPYSFDPSVHEFYAPLLVGGRLVMARPGEHGNPAYLAQVIQEEQVTALHLVPSLLNALVNEPDFANCHSLRHVFSGGEVLTRDLQDRFFAIQSATLHNLYGPTEATIDATFWTCDRGSNDPEVPIGRPTDNMSVYVLDEALQPVPVGVVGELHIGGVGLATGYLHQPELTAERFIPHPFSESEGERLYKTGDLVRYRADGAVVYVGRRDHQIKLRGFRLELGEIEARLRQHPAISSCAVGAPEDDRGGRKLAAYVVIGNSEAPTPGELRAFLRERLPEYMVPAAYVFLESLPMTPNGKVDRKALPLPTQQRAEIGIRHIELETPTERAIGEIWSEVLRVDRIGALDNFFDLGGYSLQLVEVLAAIEGRLGVHVNPAYAQSQTLRQLASVCDEMTARGEARKPEPVTTSGAKVRSAVRRMLGSVGRETQ